MNDEFMKNVIKGMVSILNEASDAYYNTGNPIMSDEMFDAKLQELRELEEETGYVLSNSPTQRVGAKVLTELKEIEHSHPMLSLEKCHSVDEIVKFGNNKPLVASVKLDGLTVSLTYENGLFVKGETRGDGYVGSDITEHIKQFKNVPMKIDVEGTYVIDGEAIIKDDDFAEINKDNEFKNSRNLASGTLASLDTSLAGKRKLSFLAWDVIEGGNNSLHNNLEAASTLGFEVVPHWYVPVLDPKVLSGALDVIFDFALDEGLPNDGIVFKFDDIEYGKSLGATSHHFRNGIAYKAPDKMHKTQLLDITYDIGKTGVLTPVAVFNPVEIDGSVVEKASLANLSITTETLGNPFVGQEIFVSKRNMVIPKVEKAVKIYILSDSQKPILIPKKCPACGSETEIKQDNESKVLVCTNPKCKGRLLSKLVHFVSKTAMNIDGLSEATLEKFIELGWLNSFEDIYRLKDYEDQMKSLEGFGEKSVDKLLKSIEKSKQTTLDRFINALSIPLIGRSASKTIANHFNYSFSYFFNKFDSQFDYTVLSDFGKNMSDSLNKYAEENGEEVFKLASKMTFAVVEAQKVDKLKGQTFVITGSLHCFSNRDELKDKIESLGGKVSGSVSKKTNYLICNDNDTTSSKCQKATELGVAIITEDDLLTML